MAQLGTAILSLDREGQVTTANPAVLSMLGLTVMPGDDLRAALDEDADIEREALQAIEDAVAFAEAGTWEPVADLARDLYGPAP